jgi:hypothetical protein
MTHTDDLMDHPPAMAEMAGAAIESESHEAAPHFEPDAVPPGLATLEAETEA